MTMAIKLEFPDDRAADVIRWLQAAPKGVEVYLVTSEPPEAAAPPSQQPPKPG